MAKSTTMAERRRRTAQRVYSDVQWLKLPNAGGGGGAGGGGWNGQRQRVFSI